jgi:hypothetical protein
MAIHDRRPRSIPNNKLEGARYREFWQSSQFETLEILVDELIDEWIRGGADSSSLDAYTMDSLTRDGKIEGILFLKSEIERRANLGLDKK